METAYLVPNNYSLIYSQKQIQARVEELGSEIQTWVKKSKNQTNVEPLAICILRGAIFFYSDLLRNIHESLEPTFCRTWSYSSETNTQLSNDAVRINVSDVEAEGRPILMIDDICDTGATLSKLESVFLNLGASEVKSAVLIQRTSEKAVYCPTWAGFKHSGPEWFVGYGMEDKNQYSNLSDIYEIKSKES